MSYTRNIDYLHGEPESRLILQKSEYAYKKNATSLSNGWKSKR
jgi:hypothetical protein